MAPHGMAYSYNYPLGIFGHNTNNFEKIFYRNVS